MAGLDNGWLQPQAVVEPGQPGVSSRPAMFELRPLSLGEVLDRTFAIYRSRFWLFASISAVSASVQVIVQALSLATAHTIIRSIPRGPGPVRNPVQMGTFVAAEARPWLAALAFFLVAAITQAATSLALSEVYLNRPASAKGALRIAVRRWYRWIGIALWQIGSLAWVPFAVAIPGLLLLGEGAHTNNPTLSVLGGVVMFAAILGGVPVGVILYLRNALAVPSAMVEKLKIRAAMRRSKVLAAGTKGRIFVVLLIASVLYWVVGVLESPAAFLIMFAPRQEHYLAQALTLIITFVGHTVVAPVALIGLTLVYFDQRVRKEALDVQLLLENTRGGAGFGAPVVSAAPLAPERTVPIE